MGKKGFLCVFFYMHTFPSLSLPCWAAVNTSSCFLYCSILIWLQAVPHPWISHKWNWLRPDYSSGNIVYGSFTVHPLNQLAFSLSSLIPPPHYKSHHMLFKGWCCVSAETTRMINVQPHSPESHGFLEEGNTPTEKSNKCHQAWREKCEQVQRKLQLPPSLWSQYWFVHLFWAPYPSIILWGFVLMEFSGATLAEHISIQLLSYCPLKSHLPPQILALHYSPPIHFVPYWNPTLPLATNSVPWVTILNYQTHFQHLLTVYTISHLIKLSVPLMYLTNFTSYLRNGIWIISFGSSSRCWPLHSV